MNRPSYPYGEFDASKWAADFMQRFGSRLLSIDETLMIGWFANAIMTGYDRAKNEALGASPETPQGPTDLTAEDIGKAESAAYEMPLEGQRKQAIADYLNNLREGKEK